jgi:hypothetical protein
MCHVSALPSIDPIIKIVHVVAQNPAASTSDIDWLNGTLSLEVFNGQSAKSSGITFINESGAKLDKIRTHQH